MQKQREEPRRSGSMQFTEMPPADNAHNGVQDKLSFGRIDWNRVSRQQGLLSFVLVRPLTVRQNFRKCVYKIRNRPEMPGDYPCQGSERGAEKAPRLIRGITTARSLISNG